MNRKVFAAGIAFLGEFLNAYSEAKACVETFSQEVAYVTWIQDYINGIRTLQADLTQVTHLKDGRQQRTSGQCWLDKTPQPKQSRSCQIRVDIPGWTSLIRDGILYNCNLKQKKISKNSIEASPLAPLFSNKLDIRKQFGFYGVSLDKTNRIASITLKTSERSSTSVTLFFALYENGNICALIGWMIVDAAGTTTQIMFDQKTIKANITLPKGTFNLPHLKP